MPPANYIEAQHWRIAGQSGRLFRIHLLALPLAALFGLGFVLLARHLSTPKFEFGARDGVAFLVGVVVTLALHEGVHGAVMQMFGARPRYGFYAGGGMFYAKAPGHAFTRRQYLVIVLGPLVGLSVLAFAAMALLKGTFMVWYVALWAIVNASAANADVWIAAVILRHPSSAYVMDEADGLRVLVPPTDRGSREQNEHRLRCR